MYTVSKGPSKIVAKTRRGLSHSQNIERLETLRDQTKKPLDSDQGQVMNVPKPVFHSVNGKRSNNQRTQQEVISPQHAELINFVCESWHRICKEYEQEPSEHDRGSNHCIVYYNDGERSPVLQDFKPFDLESWWGKRLFNNITKSI
ncbi:MAPK regulated corepressor interacting protein 2 [Schistocerca nitens]|uniref:MAPK regulated corepressor interacting protein 2 n=1 Tax=Schistocerca cancellata TaxID=274614 RepID=UPI002117D3C9|nr:MAPK regulated corepressor interacting protein 2 [Schistocerca cancellata]XP_049810030.1 MAPK regulated corepressor interacting protein 2 [Schistocerca nitens]XP_049860020.1 MAPK regulated corepressor interacting protein 2 [Schistocerca gregaria]